MYYTGVTVPSRSDVATPHEFSQRVLETGRSGILGDRKGSAVMILLAIKDALMWSTCRHEIDDEK